MNLSNDLFIGLHEGREWLQALIVLGVSLVGIAVLKQFLGRIKTKPHWNFVSALIPSILNLGYVVALSTFLEAAPLEARARVWTDHIAYVLTVCLVMILIRRALLSAVEWSAHRAGPSTTLQHGFLPLLRNIATLFVFVAGGIMVLKHFSYDVMSLVAALGVGSLAIGLAAKETLSNMISGFVLIMDGNLRHGDRVSFGGSTGDVEQVGLRSTRIRISDGSTMIVPNFDLVNNRIVNLSDPSHSRTCTASIRVPYSADFETVREICLRVLAGITKVDQSRGKWVNLSSLSEGHQLIDLGCWLTEMDDAGEVLTLFNQRVLKELRSKNISLFENSSPPSLTH